MNAVKEVSHDRTSTFLDENNIEKIIASYRSHSDVEGFCKVISTKEILSKNASLNMAQYVSNVANDESQMKVKDAYAEWNETGNDLNIAMKKMLKGAL